MEPERPIEKLVRKAGEKRLAESGGAFELHPATRRMLQGEAQRLHGKPQGTQEGGAESRTHWWASFGWSFGVFAGVVVAALLMWPREKGYQMTAANAPAAGRELHAAPAAELASKMSSRDSIVASEFSAPAASAANGRPVGNDRATKEDDLTRTVTTSGALAPDFKLALKDEAKSGNKEREVLFADKTAARKPEVRLQAGAPAAEVPTPTAAPAELSLSQSRAEVANATAAVAPASPPTSSVTLDGALAYSQNAPALMKQQVTKEADNRAKDQSGAVVDSVRFAQRKDASALKRASAKVETVLTTFSLQNEGNWLKVVDSDGSIYTGQVQNVVATTFPAAAAPKTYRALGGARSKLSDLQVETVAPPAGTLPLPQWHFMVQGTNRSLNKPVTFNGQLLFSASPPPQTNVYYFGVSQPALTNAASVSGEARIGTRSLKIEAERQR